MLGWGIVVGFLTLGQLGELLRLPQWVLDVSPYSHVPRMPLEDFELGPALVLTAMAARAGGRLAALPLPRHRLAEVNPGLTNRQRQPRVDGMVKPIPLAVPVRLDDVIDAIKKTNEGALEQLSRRCGRGGVPRGGR